MFVLILMFQDRVVQSGGWISYRSGVGRVAGALTVTRAVGDHVLQHFGVSCIPEVSPGMARKALQALDSSRHKVTFSKEFRGFDATAQTLVLFLVQQQPHIFCCTIVFRLWTLPPPHNLFILMCMQVKTVARTRDARFLLIGSDGLWDAVGNQEAVDLVSASLDKAYQMVARPQSAANVAASVLTRVALKKGSQDNVTALVVLLSD